MGLLILPSAALQPALYLASHDIVVLLALSGLGLLRRSPPRPRAASA